VAWVWRARWGDDDIKMGTSVRSKARDPRQNASPAQRRVVYETPAEIEAPLTAEEVGRRAAGGEEKGTSASPTGM